MPDDDRMLERLGRALAPPPAQPHEAEIRMVRQVVVRLRGRRARGEDREDSLAPEPDWGVAQLPPAILRSPVSAAAGARSDPGGPAQAGDVRLLA
ncbi:MAG TPA: hypothetical protein VG226_11485 [Acidimicrobiales bacterium]|nr:hypothetical protein [Acidimicrobiales bacterium]